MTTVILIGASTRAAAMSARRAGWTPWCADLFADADLERIAAVRKVPAEAYPEGLLEALKEAPPGPVIYTGALENRPDIIERIDRPLWGNSADVLRAVRTPERWTECLQAHGLPCPAVTREAKLGRWLLKPCKGASGFGIHVFDGRPFDPRTHFLQQQIDGIPVSALFLGDGNDATLLGMTEQLIGTPWLNATGFHYAGNLGPLALDTTLPSRIGSTLTREFHLRGLFGVDAILSDGELWPIEINPRYTAAAEVLERAFDVECVSAHASMFTLANGGHERPECATKLLRSLTLPARQVWGKAILYARRALRFDGVRDDGRCADIPHVGEVIEQGRPLLTLFASGTSIEACRAKLQEIARGLDRRWWG